MIYPFRCGKPNPKSVFGMPTILSQQGYRFSFSAMKEMNHLIFMLKEVVDMPNIGFFRYDWLTSGV
jgi:hypothetical protein